MRCKGGCCLAVHLNTTSYHHKMLIIRFCQLWSIEDGISLCVNVRIGDLSVHWDCWVIWNGQPKLRVYEWPNSDQFVDIGVKGVVGKCTKLACNLMMNRSKCIWSLGCSCGSHVTDQCKAESSLGKCMLIRHGLQVPVGVLVLGFATHDWCEYAYVSEQLGTFDRIGSKYVFCFYCHWVYRSSLWSC